MAANFSNGRLRAAPEIILGPAGAYPRRRHVNVTLHNTSEEDAQAVSLQLLMEGGQSRVVARATLGPCETLLVANLPVDDADTLTAFATDTNVVDYVVSESCGGTLAVTALDINGAVKQAAAPPAVAHAVKPKAAIHETK